MMMVLYNSSSNNSLYCQLLIISIVRWFIVAIISKILINNNIVGIYPILFNNQIISRNCQSNYYIFNIKNILYLYIYI